MGSTATSKRVLGAGNRQRDAQEVFILSGVVAQRRLIGLSPRATPEAVGLLTGSQS
jgi:hypothetical protein